MRSQGRASEREGERESFLGSNKHAEDKKLHVITHLFKSFPLQMNKESVPSFTRHHYVMMSARRGEPHHSQLVPPQCQHNTTPPTYTHDVTPSNDEPTPCHITPPPSSLHPPSVQSDGAAGQSGGESPYWPHIDDYLLSIDNHSSAFIPCLQCVDSYW